MAVASSDSLGRFRFDSLGASPTPRFSLPRCKTCRFRLSTIPNAQLDSQQLDADEADQLDSDDVASQTFAREQSNDLGGFEHTFDDFRDFRDDFGGRAAGEEVLQHPKNAAVEQQQFAVAKQHSLYSFVREQAERQAIEGDFDGCSTDKRDPTDGDLGGFEHDFVWQPEDVVEAGIDPNDVDEQIDEQDVPDSEPEVEPLGSERARRQAAEPQAIVKLRDEDGGVQAGDEDERAKAGAADLMGGVEQSVGEVKDEETVVMPLDDAEPHPHELKVARIAQQPTPSPSPHEAARIQRAELVGSAATPEEEEHCSHWPFTRAEGRPLTPVNLGEWLRAPPHQRPAPLPREAPPPREEPAPRPHAQRLPPPPHVKEPLFRPPSRASSTASSSRATAPRPKASLLARIGPTAPDLLQRIGGRAKDKPPKQQQAKPWKQRDAPSKKHRSSLHSPLVSLHRS